MKDAFQLKNIGLMIAAASVIVLVAGPASADHQHVTGTFTGAKVNAGTVMHGGHGSLQTLTLSDEFLVPDTPDPHWQVVDSKGNVYLLQHLIVKGDKLTKTITLPTYVHDVAKVQIWCAYAEVVLGEASFPDPVR